MKKLWILVKTNGFGEILSLDVFGSHYDAQCIMKSEYEADMIEAEHEGKGVSGCACCEDYAWLELDQDENYQWDVFEREIPE